MTDQKPNAKTIRKFHNFLVIGIVGVLENYAAAYAGDILIFILNVVNTNTININTE